MTIVRRSLLVILIGIGVAGGARAHPPGPGGWDWTNQTLVWESPGYAGLYGTVANNGSSIYTITSWRMTAYYGLYMDPGGGSLTYLMNHQPIGGPTLAPGAASSGWITGFGFPLDLTPGWYYLDCSLEAIGEQDAYLIYMSQYSWFNDRTVFWEVPVPEPGGMLALFGGLASLGTMRLRRRK